MKPTTATEILAEHILYLAGARLVGTTPATNTHPTLIHFALNVPIDTPVFTLPVFDLTQRSVRLKLREFAVDSVEEVSR